MGKGELTERQDAVYQFISQRIRSGLPPTVREIGAEFGISSPNGVMGHLKALAAKGWIVRDGTVSRGIRLAKPQKPGRMPLVGRVAAGRVYYSGAKR